MAKTIFHQILCINNTLTCNICTIALGNCLKSVWTFSVYTQNQVDIIPSISNTTSCKLTTLILHVAKYWLCSILACVLILLINKVIDHMALINSSREKICYWVKNHENWKLTHTQVLSHMVFEMYSHSIYFSTGQRTYTI